MTFAQPWWLLLLLALPVLAWLRGKRGPQAALLYSSVQLAQGLGRFPRSKSGAILLAMRWLALALLIIAMARPQVGEGESKVKASGIDIVVAFDLSDSMAAEDFEWNGQTVNRLFIARKALKEFIEKRTNDRIGLVAFSGRAYIAAPLSLDHEFLLANLERFTLDTVPEEGTAIGAAISASVNRLRDIKSKSRIVILLTDGQNTVGRVPPLIAAEAAQALKIKVYTIGVGTHGVARLPRIDPFGRKVYTAMNVDIDEDSLKEIARRTGGRYYRADNSESLRRIYSEIDTMERTEATARKVQYYREMFPWFVWPGLGLLLLEVLLGQTVWRRLP
ncbi:MAG TPA: VWA domain-containing protein [Roseimicrobium sp.]|nr:VWA domain-containing protein [Roseimicrobium sp.]